MADLCVAHLVRRKNGTAPFRDFLASYAKHPAGEVHDLLIVFKGFTNPHHLAPYETMLEGIAHRRVFMSDFGFDIGAYRKVAGAFPYTYFAFMNSYSRIMHAGWLESMRRHAARPGVGIVSATASYQSILSDLIEMRRALPRYGAWTLAARRHGRYFLSVKNRFPPYPNPHVRTNAFLIGRELFSALRDTTVVTKWDAYRFESGINGMTRQIIGAGLLALIAGRDGAAYDCADWPDSRTFWSGGQENLLVEDNQTRLYEGDDHNVHERLAYLAWRRWPDGRPRIQAPCNLFPEAE